MKVYFDQDGTYRTTEAADVTVLGSTLPPLYVEFLESLSDVQRWQYAMTHDVVKPVKRDYSL